MASEQSNSPAVSAENPYSSPLTTSPAIAPDAPAPFGWELAGQSVRVRKNSQLPMVDPFTGGVTETMMLQRVEVRFRPRWLMAIPLAGGVLAMAAEHGSGAVNVISLFLTGMFVGWLVSLFVGLFFPYCTLRVFITHRTLRIRKTCGWIMNGLFLLFLPGAFVFSFGPPWMNAIPVVALAVWLIGTVAGLVLIRRLRCRSRQDDCFVIHGFHPKALEALAVNKATGGPQTAR